MTLELLRQLLEEDPNLYLALKVEERESAIGGGRMPNRTVDENWAIRPEWLAFITDFSDRFVVGGDEFVELPGRTPCRQQSFEETWSILDQPPSSLAGRVGRDNARRIYNLE